MRFEVLFDDDEGVSLASIMACNRTVRQYAAINLEHLRPRHRHRRVTF